MGFKKVAASFLIADVSFFSSVTESRWLLPRAQMIAKEISSVSPGERVKGPEEVNNRLSCGYKAEPAPS